MVEIINNQSSDTRIHMRYSHVKNYPACPKMYKLSTEHSPEPSDSAKRAMARGNLFEFFMFGESSDPRDINEIIKKKKGAFDGMQKKTVDGLKEMAKEAQKHIVELHYTQLHIQYDKDPRYVFHSHLDFIGVVQFNNMNSGNPFVAIVDTKWTASIEQVWNNKSTKEDFLQAIIYIWQVYENTGKLLPFVYLIAQRYHDEVFIKPIKIEATLEDFNWFKTTYIEAILNDHVFVAKPSSYNCLGVKGTKGKCRYLQFCDAGKKMVQTPEQFNYGDLNI